MKIYRNGKEIVLTDEEIMEAHAEHIKSFMRNELITVYGLPDEEAEDYAELAYSHYTSGNGYTEDRLVLAEPWFNFPAGTDQEEIWAWFDERYSGGVAKIMFPSLFNPSQKEPSETASLS